MVCLVCEAVECLMRRLVGDVENRGLDRTEQTGLYTFAKPTLNYAILELSTRASPDNRLFPGSCFAIHTLLGSLECRARHGTKSILESQGLLGNRG